MKTPYDAPPPRWLSFDVGRPPFDGYLDDIANDFLSIPRVHALANLEDIGCLVLLGQAGMGKTHEALRATKELEQRGEMADRINIGQEPNPHEFLSRLLESQSATEFTQGRDWHLFIDGLDETAGSPEQLVAEIGSFIDKLFQIKNTGNLKLRLLCRTSAWSSDHDRLVETRWNESQLRKLELGPLYQDEIADLVVEKLDHHSSTFLNGIKEHHAQGLASRPILLQLLVDVFRANGTFPNTRARLYQLGLEKIVQRSPRVTTMGKRSDLERRLLISGRIAVTTMFSGHSHITTNSSISSDKAVRTTDLLGQIEFAEGEALSVTSTEIRAALNTPLFARIAPDTYEWVHRTFIEFLTANYLVLQRVPALDLWKLLIIEDPDGKETIAPHLREVAAWLAGMVPDFFQLLIEFEPALLLRSDLAAATPQDRSLLVDALLDRISAGELFDFYEDVRPYLGKLGHPDLVSQLSSRLTDKSQSPELRQIVVSISKETELRSFIPTILDVATDSDDVISVRKASIDTVAAIGTPQQKALLTPILGSDMTRDTSDEIRGAVLRATWPDQLTASQLFAALAPRKDRNLIGAYAMFLHRFEFKERPIDDLLEAVSWLAAALKPDSADEWAREAERIFQRVFWACAEEINNPSVRSSLASLVAKQFASVNRYVLSTSHDGISTWTSDIQSRCAFVVECLGHSKEPVDLAQALVNQGAGLIRVDDLHEYIKLRSEAKAGAPTSAIVRIIVSLTQKSQIEEVAFVWDATEPNDELYHALQSAFTTDLQSSNAKWLREHWFREREIEKDQQTSGTEVQEGNEVTRLLDLIENGDFDLWWQLNLQLFVDASGNFQDEFEFRGDLRAAPGWALVSSSNQVRIINGAKAYLTDASLTNLSWLGTNTSFRPASAGYRALRLLLDTEPRFLDELSFVAWRRWAPVTLGFFENDFHTDGSKQEQLLSIAYSRAPNAILGTIARIALGKKSNGLGPREIDLISTITDPRMNAFLSRLAHRGKLKGTNAKSGLIGVLARVGDVSIVEKIRSRLEMGHRSYEDIRAPDEQWIIEGAAQLLQTAPQEIWGELIDLAENNGELARSIWSNFAEKSDFEETDALISVSTPGLAKVYVDLATLFPDLGRQNGGTRVLQASDYIEGFRSKILDRIVNSGTSEAIQALNSIAKTLPGPRIEWKIEQARQVYRHKRKTLHEPAEILAQIAALGQPFQSSTSKPIGPTPQGHVVADGLPPEEYISVPADEKTGKLPAGERRTILALATEWSSGHGGISTLNRELCTAMADLGHKVWCAVTEATADEIHDAAESAVNLVVCPKRPGLDEASCLLLLGEGDFENTQFDVLLGHDHITGPHASALSLKFKAKYVHFLHTVPQHTEALKTRTGTPRLLKGDDKRKEQLELGQTANLVVAIGPKIYDIARGGFEASVNLHMLMPGMSLDLLAHKPDLTKLTRNTCLISARMEDASAKGLRLACEAVVAAGKHEWDPGLRPKLLAQGFDPDQADIEFDAISGNYESILQARPYTKDRKTIRSTLFETSVLLMPSLSEGFGLTGYEAIAAGVPVLISDESGLAEYINTAVSAGILCQETANATIMPALEEEAATKWAPNIISILKDRKEAFEKAETLRNKLRPILSWNNAARELSLEIQKHC